jgi:hypothetical protein
MQPLTLHEQQQIIQIRLLIAFAAQVEHLNWWEDNALSPAGSHLLDRAFVFAPEEAGRKLALLTARSRYQAAFETEPESLHLFRLEPTGEIEYHLRSVEVKKLTLPEKPPKSVDDLKQALLKLTSETPGYKLIAERPENRLEIRMLDDSLISNPLRLTQVFAWASQEGRPGVPVFPYLSSR